jgi:hypothetical protein
MIPSSGCIYCVSQLTSVADLSQRRSLTDWVSAAREHGGYLAAANDLGARAEFMLEKGLVTIGEAVYVSPRLRAINALPRERAEYELARLILLFDPPQWLDVAVDSRRVERAYIPEYDLDYLSWIEPHLDELLCDVFRQLQPKKSTIEEELGWAAERVVMGALQHAGLQPVHVALISDAYGYDIEVRRETVDRIEVKAAGPRTAGSFHLSRNEYEKCLRHGSEWRLIQVVFSNAAFVASRLDLSHIKEVYEVSAADIRSIIPPDSPGFKWEDSALLTPARESWQIWDSRPRPDFSIEGLACSP